MSKEVNKQQQTILLIAILIGGLGYAFYAYLLAPKWKSIADLKVKMVKIKTEVRTKKSVINRSSKINLAFNEAYTQIKRLKKKDFAPKIDIVVWLANYTKQLTSPFGLDSRSFHYRQVGITDLISGTLNVGKPALEDFQIEIDAECSLEICNKLVVECEKNPLLSVLSMDLLPIGEKGSLSFRFVIPRLNEYGYSMLSKIDKFITQQKIVTMTDKELDLWIEKKNSLLFHSRGYLHYSPKNSRNLFRMVADPEADRLAISKHQAEVIKNELKSYHVSSVVNGSKPMCKFTNGSKWYKLGETFYVGKQKLPVKFSKVLSNPIRVLLTSGDVQVIKKVNRK